MHWRRKWQPTPVFLPGESQGRGSLVGCRLWGRTESDTTEATSLSHFTFMHWRRTWQPTPVFLPREPQGLRGLVGCRPWGHTDSDTTETTSQQQQQQQQQCIDIKRVFLSFRNIKAGVHYKLLFQTCGYVVNLAFD